VPDGSGKGVVAATGQDVLGPLVDRAWLERHAAGAAPPVVVDVRWYLDGRSGRAAYEAGHVPGAVFVDLETVLAAPAERGGGRHPLPDPRRFAEGLAAAGIGDASVVVAYDDLGGTIAARLVWLLRALGEPAALLDGGLGAFAGELEEGAVVRSPLSRSPRPWPEDRLAGLEEVVGVAGSASGDAAAGRQGVDGPGAEAASGERRRVGPAVRCVLLDGRAPERFRGEVEPVDPAAGHVPGARNLPVASLVDPVSGRWRCREELRALFAGLGIGEAEEVVAYCGSGVTACALLLAAEQAALRPGRLWPGSWSEWSRHPDLPVATGGG
jgi:thiosulfate/3-mercaptopyruvate sulfurtransferase